MEKKKENNDKISFSMRKLDKDFKQRILFLSALLLLIIFFLIFSKNIPLSSFLNIIPSKKTPAPISQEFKLKKFDSDSEFRSYLEESEETQTYFTGSGGIGIQRNVDFAEDITIGSKAPSLETVERVSETNVQVMGIDEPDIVKTDGKNIFLSNLGSIFRPLPAPIDFMEGEETGVETIISPDYYPRQATTNILRAFPPEELSKIGSIDEIGDLLYYNGLLIIFSGNKVVAYDVYNPEEPKLVWDYSFDQNQSILSSRLIDGKIIIALRKYVDKTQPCPIPLIENGRSIACTDVYHPIISIPVDSTYTVLKINAKDGKLTSQNSFMGTSGLSLMYMSHENLYLTYTFYNDLIDFFYRFFNEEAVDLVNEDVTKKLENLKDVDISNQAKLTEFSFILQSYLSSLSMDEIMKFENEMENKMQNYVTKHARDLEQSGIVKISLDNLEISATGGVPGRPLNQFSMDEYKGNFRVATTVGVSNFVGQESFNDVYILDDNLQIISQVTNLGKGEKIYAVRFINDVGYVVTFKEIDPFYVINLKDPFNPKVEGELKIPGYSSYLHPIRSNLILGIGKEDQNVKLSLFDVSDPSNPNEVSKYRLDEYWSDILNTHRAFLIDYDREIFFIPGSKGAYIFSYKEDNLSLETAVSTNSAKRAIYINNYLYVISDNQVIILNEDTWERVNTLDL